MTLVSLSSTILQPFGGDEAPPPGPVLTGIVDLESGDPLDQESGSHVQLETVVDHVELESGQGGVELESGQGAVDLESQGAPPAADLLHESDGDVELESGGDVNLEGDLAAPIYLGRYRLGDYVPLAFSLPATPIAAPSASIIGPSPSQAVAQVVPLWTRDLATFQSSLLAGQALGVGTFLVTATFTLSGAAQTQQQQFDVVAGGDAEGSLVAIHAHEGAVGRSVIVQTASGKLLQGSDPWV